MTEQRRCRRADLIIHRDDRYELDTIAERIGLDRVHRCLSTDTFWAIGRSRETVERRTPGTVIQKVRGERARCAHSVLSQQA